LLIFINTLYYYALLNISSIKDITVLKGSPAYAMERPFQVLNHAPQGPTSLEGAKRKRESLEAKRPLEAQATREDHFSKAKKKISKAEV